MVEVYLWQTGSFGHISLKVDDGSPPGTMYLSRFPASMWGMLAGGGYDQKYAQDLRSYGAPSVVRLSRLNETSVKKAVVHAEKTMIYSFLEANCSTHVKFCLDAGIGGLSIISNMGGAFGFVLNDSPWGVFHYAEALRALYG